MRTSNLHWGFPNMGIPKYGWSVMENPIKMDDFGYPHDLGSLYIVTQKHGFVMPRHWYFYPCACFESQGRGEHEELSNLNCIWYIPSGMYIYILCYTCVIYHLVICYIAMENHHAIKNGKPSISIRAIYTMAMIVITIGYIYQPFFAGGWSSIHLGL